MLAKILRFEGKASSEKTEVFPVGRSIVHTDGILTVSYISADGQLKGLFVLDPGRHHVMCPDDVLVDVDCKPSVRWSVRWPNRYNPFDPVRMEVSVVRPLNEREEMREYMNELLARSLGGKVAEQLRSGEAEIDVTADDYSEQYEEEEDTHLSVHQLSIIMANVERDLMAARKRAPAAADQADKPVPDKDGQGDSPSPSASDPGGENKPSNKKGSQ